MRMKEATASKEMREEKSLKQRALRYPLKSSLNRYSPDQIRILTLQKLDHIEDTYNEPS